MAESTGIEWCDSTWNPWIGCTKVSPGCDHCYAESRMDTRLHVVQCGPEGERKRTSAENWRGPVTWNANAAAFQAAHGRRQRVFCASLADVFDNAVPDAWRADLFALIAATPNLDWLLLTKRIGNAWKMMADACGVSMASLTLPRPNLWLGATVVNQAEADRDIPKLLVVPARVRFLSIEPMLGPVDLRFHFFSEPTGRWRTKGGKRQMELTKPTDGGIHWVIAGGESGPGARPMHPDWACSLRDQCKAAGVPFLFKQWGEWVPISQTAEGFTDRLYKSRRVAKLHEDQGALDDSYGRDCTVPYGVLHAGGSFHEPLEPMAFLQGSSPMTTYKVGKKAAGRLLDGAEHSGYPR